MKRLVRLVSACSIAICCAAVTPALANADPGQPGKEEAGGGGSAHHGAKMFERVLSRVELRPEQQKKIDKLLDEGARRYQPVREAKRDLMMELADQVEKGQVNRRELTGEIDALAWAMAEAHPRDRAAFEELHAILDREQRGQFVRAVQEGWEAIERAHAPSSMAEKIAEELDLTAEQQSKLQQIFFNMHQIREALPEQAKRRERWTRILEAFKSDRFDLDEVAPMGNVAEQRTKMIEGILTAFEVILPVLTKEQHVVLAQKLQHEPQGGGIPNGAPMD